MYFVHVIHEAERRRTREEQLAYNARTGRLAAGLRDLRASLAVTARRAVSFTTRGRGMLVPTAQCPSPTGPSPAGRPVPVSSASSSSVSGRSVSGRSVSDRDLVGSGSGPAQH